MEGEEEFTYMRATEPPKDCLELSLVERPTQAFYGLVFENKTFVPINCKVQNGISEAISQFRRIVYHVTAAMFVNIERHSLVYKTGEKTGVEYQIVALPGRGMLDNIYIVTDQTAYAVSKGFYAMLKEAYGSTEMIVNVEDDKNYGVEWAYATQREALNVSVDDELTEAINSNGCMKAFAERSTLKLKGREWRLEKEGSQFYLVDGSYRRRVLPIPSLWIFKDGKEHKVFTADASRQLEHCYRNGILSSEVKVNDRSYIINMSTEPFFEIHHPYFFLRREVIRIGLPLSMKHRDFLKLARKFQTVQTQVPWEWGLSAHLDSEPKQVIYQLDKIKDEEEYNEVIKFIEHERKTQETGLVFSGHGFENTSPIKKRRSEPSQSTPDYEIVQIRRLMNPVVFLRFREYANKISAFWGSYLEQGAPSSKYLRRYSNRETLYDVRTNEYYMWHGGGKDETDAILKTQRFQLEEQPDYPFGKGVFFSESFSEALKFCRCKHCNGSLLTPPLNRSQQCACEAPKEAPIHTVFLCRTVLGNPLIVRDADDFSLHKQESLDASMKSNPRRVIFEGFGEQSPLPSFGVTMNVVIVYDKDEKGSKNQAEKVERKLRFNRHRPKLVDISTMDTTSHALSNAVVHFCMHESQKIELLKQKVEACAIVDSFHYWIPDCDKTVKEAVEQAIESSDEKRVQGPTNTPIFHKHMLHRLECNDTQSADSTFVEDQHSGRPARVPPKELADMMTHSGRDLARSHFDDGKFDHRAFVVYNTLASYPFYAVDYRFKSDSAAMSKSSST